MGMEQAKGASASTACCNRNRNACGHQAPGCNKPAKGGHGPLPPLQLLQHPGSPSPRRPPVSNRCSRAAAPPRPSARPASCGLRGGRERAGTAGNGGEWGAWSHTARAATTCGTHKAWWCCSRCADQCCIQCRQPSPGPPTLLHEGPRLALQLIQHAKQHLGDRVVGAGPTCTGHRLCQDHHWAAGGLAQQMGQLLCPNSSASAEQLPPPSPCPRPRLTSMPKPSACSSFMA